jgi:hypothetical protein
MSSIIFRVPLIFFGVIAGNHIGLDTFTNLVTVALFVFMYEKATK